MALTRSSSFLSKENGEPVKAVIYARVSHDARDTARSVTEQEAEGRVWVEHQGWQLVGKEVWVDNDRSASKYATKPREEWEDLLEFLRSQDVDILTVWEPARATRDMVVWANLSSMCAERGIKIGASGRVYDLDDPEDAFQLNLFFALAAREPAIVRKRVMRAHRANAAAGRPHGRVLYGYRREYHPMTGAPLRQVPDETPRTAFAPACLTARAWVPISSYTRASLVREAAQRVYESQTFLAICKDLNHRGVPAPQHGLLWRATTLRKMVLNPGYIGKRVFQGKVVGDAAWEPLLKPEIYYPLVAKMAERTTARTGAIKHYLSGLLTCGVCGGRMRIFQAHTENASYACMKPRLRPGDQTFHTGRREVRMHTLIEGLIARRLSRPDAYELFAQDQRDAERLRGLLARKGQLDAEYTEILQLGKQRKLTPRAVAEFEAGLLPQIEEVDQQIKAIRLTSVAFTLVRPTPEDVARAWGLLSVAQKRQVVTAVFDYIKVFPLGRGKWQRGDLLQGIELGWRGQAQEPDAEPEVPEDETATRVQRVVPPSGRICVAMQRMRIGAEHAGKTVTVVVEADRLIVLDGEERLLVRPRLTSGQPRPNNETWVGPRG